MSELESIRTEIIDLKTSLESVLHYAKKFEPPEAVTFIEGQISALGIVLSLLDR